MKYLFLFLVPATLFAGVHSENPWRQREVKACFGGDGPEKPRAEGYSLKIGKWKSSDKAKVRRWVSEEFTPERTGISFTGFGDCAQSPDADVVIFYNRNSKVGTFIFGGLHGLSTIGPHSSSIEGHPSASGFISISKSGMDKGTVVHEFGHTAGLEHELLHPDAYEAEKNRCSLAEFRVPRNGLVYTEYDKDSVMNYCRIQGRGGSKVGLSEKDSELLRELYR